MGATRIISLESMIYLRENFKQKSPAEIADILGLEEKTVRNFISNYCSKKKKWPILPEDPTLLSNKEILALIKKEKPKKKNPKNAKPAKLKRQRKEGERKIFVSLNSQDLPPKIMADNTDVNKDDLILNIPDNDIPAVLEIIMKNQKPVPERKSKEKEGYFNINDEKNWLV